MKKIYLLTTLFISTVNVSNAQFYTQYFDGADTSIYNSVIVELDPDTTNIWQIGPPQKIIFNGASTIPNAIVTDTINNYPANNISRFRTIVFNQMGPAGIFALQWRQKLDMDTAHSGGIVEFTMDHGVTWQNAFNNPYVYNFYGFQSANFDTLNTGDFAFSGTDTTWRDIWLCFDLSWMSTFPDTISMRFTFKSDSLSFNKEGWLIDNFMAHPTFIHTVGTNTLTNYLNVFPNPASSILHIEAQKLMTFHIIEHMELIDSRGRIVQQWDNLPTKFWFDVSKYNDGIYQLKIKTNLRTETLPVIIQKQ